MPPVALAALLCLAPQAPEAAPTPLARTADASAPAWDRPILADPKAAPTQARAPRMFRDHGVGPTIDTTERPRSAFALDVDTASFGLARAALSRGELPRPAEVRVEEFIEVFAAPPSQTKRGSAPVGIEIDAVASSQRRGYQVVRITAYAHQRAPRPVDVVVAVDVSSAMATPPDLDDAREAVQALGGALTRDDRLALVELSSPPEVLAPLATPPSIADLETATGTLGPAEAPAMSEASLEAAYDLLRSRDPDRDRVLVVIGPGSLPKPAGADPRHAVWSLARAANRRGITTMPVGIGRGFFDDVLLGGLSNAGRGAYVFAHEPSDTGRQLAQTVHAPVVAHDPVLEVEFDPAAVTRYRLLGFESRREPAPTANGQPHAAALRAGGAVTALYEVKLREGAPIAWGQVRLRYTNPETGKASDVVRSLDGLEAGVALADAAAPTQLSVLAAAVAEKLRASYWARRITWSQLRERYDALPEDVRAQPDVARLGDLLDDAASLEDDGTRRVPGRTGRRPFARQPVVR
ncbi:MAG: von Willebrand factor type A domain-containing protein [Myxococcota bacterium]